jgi:hypothetical protein
MNLQAYVGNDPVNFTDPLGLCDGWGTTTQERQRRCGPDDPIIVIGTRLPAGGGSGGIGGGGGGAAQKSDSAMCAVATRVGRAAAYGFGFGLNFNSNIEKFAFSEFYKGRTAPLRLSDKVFPLITSFTAGGTRNISREVIPASRPYDPSGSFRRQVNFGNANHEQVWQLDALLGRATVIFDHKGNAVGLEDHFDFNRRSDTDPVAAEVMGGIRTDARTWCGSSATGFPMSAGTGR